jgi:uncharacterized RDD family membrane protein YckC
MQGGQRAGARDRPAGYCTETDRARCSGRAIVVHRIRKGVNMKTLPARTCPVCGGENEQREACSFCGSPLEQVQPPVSSAGLRFPPDSRGPAAGPASGPGPYPAPPVPGTPASPLHTGQPGEVASRRLAGFWIRVVAYLSDSIVIQLIIWMLFAVAVLGYSAGSSTSVSVQQMYELYPTEWGPIAGLDILIKLVYYTLFLGRSGQTPGKMLFGIKVIRTDGGPVTHGQALLRTLGYYINMFTLQIGFLWVAFDPRKQGLHDKIARTLEIHERADREKQSAAGQDRVIS